MARKLTGDQQLLFDKIVYDTLKEFAFIFVANRIEDAQGSKVYSSLDLIRSFVAEAVNKSGEHSGNLHLGFEEHGRFLDMKRDANRWRYLPAVENIKNWMKEKGEAAFIAKYKRPKGNKSNSKLIEEIAWAIAKTIKKTGIKRKRWYAKKREVDIQNLFETLVGKYVEFTQQNLKNSFEQ